MSQLVPVSRARLGISLMFFSNGFLLAILLPRYPEVKASLELSHGAFGMAVMAFPTGSILAAGIAAPLMRRFGAVPVMMLGTLLIAAGIFTAGTGASAVLFVAGLMAAGFCDSIVDAAQNAHGVLIEQRSGSSMLNSLHALWSVGATVGGLASALTAACHLPLPLLLACGGSVGVGAAVLGAMLARLPAGTSSKAGLSRQPGQVRDLQAWRIMLLLIVLAICGTLFEEIANAWSAVVMQDVHGAGSGIAGLGFTVMLACQFVGRLAGDPMTDRWGRMQVAGLGSIVTLAGALVQLAAPGPLTGLLGFALMGFGCATLVPAAYASAARLPGLPQGTGAAVMSWLMRLGFLLASPLVGLIGEATSLRWSMLVPVTAALIAVCVTVLFQRSDRLCPP